ncbi:MAG: hypothetical protein O7F73_18540 [Gammaproteobacteria bacterium]|nr:hypothetical protein [Gammaproteobacteria bacterium]
MNILHTEWWSIAIAPEWWTEREEDAVVIGDRDEVGSILISTLCKDNGEFQRSELEQIAEDNAAAGCRWRRVSAGDFSGIVSSYEEEGSALREWYLSAGSVLLFVTYCCEQEHAGMDDAAVDEILDTLQVAEA